MKAISTVIASILMLMIVIGLGGTAYLYISGTFTGKTSTTFEIIDEVSGTVTIRNSGTEPITRITATLNGNSENIAVIPNIPGLVAYWSFNEGGGDKTTDSSGNKNTGNLKPSCPDCPAWDTGRHSNALKFDGSNDYVDAGYGIKIDSGPATWSAWIKTSTSGSQGIIGGNNVAGQYAFYISPDNVVKLSVCSIPSNIGCDSFAQQGTTLTTDGRWHHVAATRNGGTLQIYVDGVLEASGTNARVAGDDIDAGGWYPLRIGDDRWSAGLFNGIIDEVAIFNRALNAAEVKQLSSGLLSPGQLASVKPLTSLSKGTHTLRLCTPNMCNTAILTII